MSNPFKKNKEEDKENDQQEVVLQENVEVFETPAEEKEPEQTETTEQPTGELEKLKADYETLNNQYIRLAADFDNYRKRQAQERESLLKYGAENTMKKLLEVLDNFERGKKAVENIDDCQKVKESYELVCKQMYDTLQKLGLEFIETEGKEFDPNLHEAVMQTPSSDVPEHTIIAELQRGYKLEDRVLRPALVNVAVSE
ncbi:nucleotide exchange factor GrpE [bacterium]|nr:nucleotide exchange factor GrpE [bacterium]